jgi:hypothetical protein
MRIKIITKYYVFSNQNGEDIAGYLIHLNKNITKWKSKKQHNTGANWMEFQNVYVLQFVKSFTIYYIKWVCLRIWVKRVYVQELRWESAKKVPTEKTS